ncbi:uncharacterized protein LOC118747076 isoform X1 [Rhagoletis pomonella]|uniref:uncharacterized protein LOC118747076 isoform X1 n=2 Tax=Rhagoletis pomonella TaxID=28610 RepID=UPI0017823A36|nr:uncharacterized protein LOC118747076 isoform X1 [Rhagoletis pomonella]
MLLDSLIFIRAMSTHASRFFTVSPIGDDIYECQDGTYCTSSDNVCESDPSSSNNIIVCNESTASCGSSCQGKASGKMICSSSTQFALCINEVASDPLSCPTNQYCSEDLYNFNLKKVCAPLETLDFLEAQITCPSTEEITPTTQSTTPTTTTTQSQAYLLGACNNSTETSYYFQVANPANCNTYIYCERSGSSFLALEMNCRSGLYYSAAQKKCIQATECPN